MNEDGMTKGGSDLVLDRSVSSRSFAHPATLQPPFPPSPPVTAATTSFSLIKATAPSRSLVGSASSFLHTTPGHTSLDTKSAAPGQHGDETTTRFAEKEKERKREKNKPCEAANPQQPQQTRASRSALRLRERERRGACVSVISFPNTHTTQTQTKLTEATP